MKNALEHIYAIGTMNQLMEGDLDRMPSAKTIKELEIDFSDDGVIVPRFVGVYQKIKTIYENYQEIEENKEIVDFDNMHGKKVAEFLASLGLFFEKGEIDKFNSDLIHIAYDSDVWPSSDSVRQIFGNGLGRIVISSLANLPNFSEKKFDAFYSLIEKGLAAKLRSSDVSKYQNSVQEELSELLEQSRVFGLTRQEYFLLTRLKDSN